MRGVGAWVRRRPEGFTLAPGLRQSGGNARQPRSRVRQPRPRAPRLGLRGGDLGSECLDLGFGAAAGVLGGVQQGLQLRQTFGRLGDLMVDRADVYGQTCEGVLRVGSDLLLARGVGADASDVGELAFDLARGGGQGAVQPVLLQGQAMQYGPGCGVLVAQRRDRSLRLQRGGRGDGGGAGGQFRLAAGIDRVGLRVVHQSRRLRPARMQHRALQAADLRREFFIPRRHARFAAQTQQIGFQFRAQIV